MTSDDFRVRLLTRAQSSDLTVGEPVIASLERYFRLLAKWNSKINLTALPLDEPTDETFDRLFIEPLSAAPFIGDCGNWFDLGSGGGSPALPLLVLRPELRLTMVESRAKKATFLREALRALGLTATVLGERFEDLPRQGSAMLVSARAVRPDAEFYATARGLLRPDGRLLLFSSSPEVVNAEGFAPIHAGASFVVFHVEQ